MAGQSSPTRRITQRTDVASDCSHSSFRDGAHGVGSAGLSDNGFFPCYSERTSSAIVQAAVRAASTGLRAEQ